MTETQPLPGTTERIAALDGMRGVAILMVIFVHWAVIPLKAEFGDTSPNLFNLPGQLAHGVDIFFVISGFLIGRILLTQSDHPSFLKAFYIRRFFRIVPLYYAVVIAFALGRFLFGGYSDDLVPLWAYFMFVSNFYDAAGWDMIPEYTIFWSLAIEEQFYLASAAVAVFFGRNGVISLAVTFVVTSVVLRALNFIEFVEIGGVWQFTFTHLDPIGIGLLTAALLTNPRATAALRKHASKVRLVGILSFMAFVGTGQINSIQGLGNGVLTISIAVATWIILKFVSEPKSLLTFAPLQRIGEMSFSLYIIHNGWLVYAGWFVGSIGEFGLLKIAISLPLLFAFSRLIWVYVEQPLIGIGHSWEYDASADRTARPIA